MDFLDGVFAPSGGTEFRALGGVTVLVNTTSGAVFELNGVASEMWQLISDGWALRAVRDRLVARYAIDRGRLERDLAAMVKSLIERGLITSVLDDARC